MENKISIPDLFLVFLHNQAVFDDGAQDLADLMNAVLDFYISGNYTPDEQYRIREGMIMYIEGKPLQDVWSYVDPHFND